MPELKRKTPCAQCPFRTTAPAGYLGASSAHDFLEATMQDAEMPCHMAIDYNKRDWFEEQYPDADLCVGALQFQRNQLKLPRPRKLSDASKVVGTNDKIMSSPQEFLNRHDNELNAKFVETARLMDPEVRRDYTRPE